MFEKRLSNIHKIKENQVKKSILLANKLNSSFYISPKIVGQANFMIPVQTDNPLDLIDQAYKKGIEFGQHFKDSINWALNYGYKYGNCPNAEKLIKKTVTIPCHYNLSEKETQKIKDIIAL